MLPNLEACDYFKRGIISYNKDGNELTSRVLIFKLKESKDYEFIFDCPNCGNKNDFKGGLEIKKVKGEDKKRNDSF